MIKLGLFDFQNEQKALKLKRHKLFNNSPRNLRPSGGISGDLIYEKNHYLKISIMFFIFH
ncbi:MAG TPA: hypothetical protein DCM38_01805 [Gammaproteobacteria bacterium]|nr:hypothetical protein [Gammaproteobacteria bacterium]